MARLRNRIRKADYFSDGELLRWPRDKRTTYSGLYAIAEDSGCLEDDCFTWKLLLWPSPLDADITVELLEQWRDELIAAGKLVPYVVAGTRYLFLRSFHKHEHPRNPQEPTIPLPPWVLGVKHPSDGRKYTYTVSEEAIPTPQAGCTSVVQGLNDNLTSSPALPCPALSGPALSSQALADADAPARANDNGRTSESDADSFAEWWECYGKVGSKADASVLYSWWRKHGASVGDLLLAASRYRHHCETTDVKIAHARTFLAKKPNRWREWADDEEHGTMDAHGDGRLSEVLSAGMEAFRLDGGCDDDRRQYVNGGPAGTALGGSPARSSVPAGELEAGE